jgi:hypothetical protein
MQLKNKVRQSAAILIVINPQTPLDKTQRHLYNIMGDYK